MLLGLPEGRELPREPDVDGLRPPLLGREGADRTLLELPPLLWLGFEYVGRALGSGPSRSGARVRAAGSRIAQRDVRPGHGTAPGRGGSPQAGSHDRG